MVEREVYRQSYHDKQSKGSSENKSYSQSLNGANNNILNLGYTAIQEMRIQKIDNNEILYNF